MKTWLKVLLVTLFLDCAYRLLQLAGETSPVL